MDKKLVLLESSVYISHIVDLNMLNLFSCCLKILYIQLKLCCLNVFSYINLCCLDYKQLLFESVVYKETSVASNTNSCNLKYC